MNTKGNLHIVSDADRLAEIVRQFDSGPDLISVRDIGWLIDIGHERDELRAEVERLRELHDRHCAFKDCRERMTPHTSIAY